jgi:hypothetical protein
MSLMIRPNRSRTWRGLAVSTIAALLLAAGPLVAQGNVSVRGTVTDGATQRPIANAVVLVVERSLRAQSDEQGVYQFRDLPAGQYTISVPKRLAERRL